MRFPVISILLLLITFSFNSYSEWVPKYRKSEPTKKLITKKVAPITKKQVVSTKSSAIKKEKAIEAKPDFKRVDVKNKIAKAEKKNAIGLVDLYKVEYKTKEQLLKLKSQTMKAGSYSVPTLIQVMKSKKFPDKNRWIATIMLGKIMGKKSSAFIAKFVNHPHWMLRMAALKTLLALNETKYRGLYAHALKDKALFVRVQALENVSKMKMKKLAPYVWNMLYDKQNYAGKKRTDIIKKIITVVGELNFEPAKKPLLKMIQKKSYSDLFNEMDSTLAALTGKSSPAGNASAKKYFWSRLALKNMVVN